MDYRVERRSLDEQLKMSQSNEMRLKAELEARMQNSYHNEMMVSISIIDGGERE